MKYIIQDWVCDYGIWDVENKRFIGAPITSYSKAISILAWVNTLNKQDVDSLILFTI